MCEKGTRKGVGILEGVVAHCLVIDLVKISSLQSLFCSVLSVS